MGAIRFMFDGFFNTFMAFFLGLALIGMIIGGLRVFLGFG